MSSGSRLISAILNREDITTPLEQGVTESVFNDEASKKAFDWIFRYYVKFRTVPKKTRFKRQFPNYRMVKDDPSEPFADVCEEIMQNVRYRHVVESVREIAEMIDAENPAVYDKFIKAGMELAGITSVGNLVKVREMSRRIDEYEKDVASGRDPMGIAFGLPTIDRATLGIHPGDLVTIAARLGAGKSNLLKHVVKTAFLDRKNVIVFSLEEHRILWQRRFDAMLNNLNYDELKALKLPKDEVKRWRENSKKFTDDFDNEVVVLSGIRNLGPTAILSYMERFKPDLVAVDGMHLLRGNNGYSADWKTITSNIDEMKQICLYTDIPAIGVVQSNRASAKEGVSTENISLADAIGQLCDVVIGVWADKKMEEAQITSVRLAKNRDGPKVEGLMCSWVLGPVIDIHELSEKELKKLAEKHIFDDED
jgi:replicative DNA helicase